MLDVSIQFKESNTIKEFAENGFEPFFFKEYRNGSMTKKSNFHITKEYIYIYIFFFFLKEYIYMCWTCLHCRQWKLSDYL